MRNHIHYDADSSCLRLLDQRLLPGEIRYIDSYSHAEVIDAIRNMAVRGAPAIGVAAAWACVLAAIEMQAKPDGLADLEKALNRIRTARPTAVNLEWAVKRMIAASAGVTDVRRLIELWTREARAIQSEDIAICRRIGQAGASLIRDGDTVLTHCNAGALATAGYGTALGVIRAAVEQGKQVRVIADETRPLLQGSRLTAFELEEDNIPVTLACDNACASLLAQGRVQIVITGADRIAANGDVANKIGTFGVAIMAHYFGVPFYVAAPLSTIDREIPDGRAIPIEQRDGKEVKELCGQMLAPQGVQALNFAFDVTPAELVAGIITEAGILRAPYKDSISAALAGTRNG